MLCKMRFAIKDSCILILTWTFFDVMIPATDIKLSSAVAKYAGVESLLIICRENWWKCPAPQTEAKILLMPFPGCKNFRHRSSANSTGQCVAFRLCIKRWATPSSLCRLLLDREMERFRPLRGDWSESTCWPIRDCDWRLEHEPSLLVETSLTTGLPRRSLEYMPRRGEQEECLRLRLSLSQVLVFLMSSPVSWDSAAFSCGVG